MSTSYRVEYFANETWYHWQTGYRTIDAAKECQRQRHRIVTGPTRIVRVETTETVLPDTGEAKPVCQTCTGRGRVTDPISAWLAVPCPACGKGEE